MFKDKWEKISSFHFLPSGLVEKIVGHTFPGEHLIFHNVLAGGCANLNIKILLKNKAPLILRLYLRDKTASCKEEKLSLLLKEKIPIPLVYHKGFIGNYDFAFTNFIEGISLRDFLQNDCSKERWSLMEEVGFILSKISTYTFHQPGALTENLDTFPLPSTTDYLHSLKRILNQKSILGILPHQTMTKIYYIFNHYTPLLPQEREKSLVHGDFDPSNILVNKSNGIWKVSGILDWEFAFSGSLLWDVATMLRYAHKMPPVFQESFLKGLQKGGIVLPQGWKLSVTLLTILSLIDCLERSDLHLQPNRCADIADLLNHAVEKVNC